MTYTLTQMIVGTALGLLAGGIISSWLTFHLCAGGIARMLAKRILAGEIVVGGQVYKITPIKPK